jgi:hypothetical protein
MDHDGKPVSPDQVPAEVRLYMAALEQHKDHAFVRGHFARITVMSVEYPSHGQVTFYVLEFRSGSNAALICSRQLGCREVASTLPSGRGHQLSANSDVDAVFRGNQGKLVSRRRVGRVDGNQARRVGNQPNKLLQQTAALLSVSQVSCLAGRRC